MLSPRAYQRITLVALLSLAFIIVTGGAVRLTGSGLGCPDWPTCDEGRLVAPLQYHALVEFVNRTVTGLVSLAVIVAVLGSVVRRPRRRDLVWLSLGLVGGVIGQIVLGGLTVLFELRPPFVMAHFLLSMVILANAVVLHWRAGESPEPSLQPRADQPPPRGPGHDLRRLGRVILTATALVVFLGTVVTAAGPHGGDEKAVRLDVPIHRAAQLHGGAAMLLLAMVVTMVVLLGRSPSAGALRRRAQVLLAVVVGQAGIGYLQYFTGVPVLLVGAHIAGATLLWATAVRFNLALGQEGPETVEAHATVLPREVVGAP